MVLQKIANMVIMGKCYLTNLSGALLAGSFIKSATSTSDKDMNIDDLLSGDGAAGQGGSLNELYTLVDSYGKAGFSIGQKIAVFAAGVALIGFFAGLIIHGKNAQKKGESKEAVPTIVVGVIGIFAVIGLLTLAQNIGGSLFTTTTPSTK